MEKFKIEPLRFFSIDHAFLLGVAGMITTCLLADDATMRGTGVFLIVYGLGLISRRVLDIQSALLDK